MNMLNGCGMYRFAYFLITLIFLLYPISMGTINGSVTFISLLGMVILAYNYRHFVALNRTLYESGFTMSFLLIWVPVILSTITSYDIKESGKIIVNLFRFYPLAIVCLLMTENEKSNKQLLYCMVAILVLFIIDALSEWLFGVNVRGFRHYEESILTFRDLSTRITGVFGSKFHLGYFLATLSPILFYGLYCLILSRGRLGGVIAMGLGLGLVIVIVISGSRAGWLTFLVAIILWGIYLCKGRAFKLKYLVITVMVAIISLGILSQIPMVKKRYEATMFQYTQGYSWFDRATSYRTVFWNLALTEVKAHPVVGIGAGSFYKIFQEQPQEKKGYFTVAHHVHLHGLEVLTETGFTGFIAYLLLNFYLLYRCLTAKSGNEWLMVALLAMMPLNTHMSIYGSFWSPMIWIPLAIGLSQAYWADHPRIRHKI